METIASKFGHVRKKTSSGTTQPISVNDPKKIPARKIITVALLQHFISLPGVAIIKDVDHHLGRCFILTAAAVASIINTIQTTTIGEKFQGFHSPVGARLTRWCTNFTAYVGLLKGRRIRVPDVLLASKMVDQHLALPLNCFNFSLI